MSQIIKILYSSSFVKFAAVGGVSTACQFTLLILLVELFKCGEVFSSALAYLGGAIVNYLLNYFVTFKSPVGHTVALPKFIVTILIGGGVNTSLFSAFFYVTGIYVAAQVMATFITLIVNYVLHKSWIYK